MTDLTTTLDAQAIADAIASTTLNAEHGVAEQLRRATSAEDLYAAADHLEVLADALGLHGSNEHPLLHENLTYHVEQIRVLAYAYATARRLGIPVRHAHRLAIEHAVKPRPATDPAGASEVEAWDAMVNGYLTTPTVASVVGSASDRPFTDWLRLQHTRTDSTGVASKWLRGLPSSWDLQLQSISQVEDAFHVSGGPGWALEDAVEEYQAHLPGLGLHQSRSDEGPLRTEPGTHGCGGPLPCSCAAGNEYDPEYWERTR